MYVIFHKNGRVTDFKLMEDDVTLNDIAVATEIPTFTSRDGFNGVLKYSADSGLYWDYKEAPAATNDYGVPEEVVAQIEQDYRDKLANEVSGNVTA